MIMISKYEVQGYVFEASPNINLVHDLFQKVL